MAETAQQPLTVFTALPANQKIGVMVVAAAFIALLIGAWMWSQSPDYRVLYGNVSDRDGGSIIAALQQMNVPYKFSEGGGAVMVPASRVHEARLKLAAQGLPKGGQVGFELMEGQKFGTSQFLEQINYQRALEGELARSIQVLSAVAAARVHLALTKPSPFLREQHKASASVLLNLHPGRSLDGQQVAAIVTLVATSVPELDAKSVTVVDQNGSLLSQNGNAPTPTLDPNQLKYVQEIEANLARRIESIVTPITGPGNVKATVTAAVDFSAVEQAEETYKPNPQPANSAIRSQQTSEAINGATGQAGGVPGALSNQPPGTASAPINAPAGAAPSVAGGAAAPGASSRRDATINYEVDKSIRHVKNQVGTIKRLSVAVVLNHLKQTDNEGKVTTQPLPKEELEKINNLVREAIGFDKDRGDSLNVVNSPFNAGEKEVLPEAPFWKSSSLWNTIMEIGKNLLIAGVLAYLVLGVLRPYLRNLMTPPAAAATELAAAGAGEGTVSIGSPAAQSAVAAYEQRLEAARQLAAADPKLVANVVRGWVSGGNE
ncbi:MAG: flagellar M-ring protein FliF [Betaproteobacteria bacterium]|nr:flagellar M-ring protein FliF [Betaproteobacteria bacterium]